MFFLISGTSVPTPSIPGGSDMESVFSGLVKENSGTPDGLSKGLLGSFVGMEPALQLHIPAQPPGRDHCGCLPSRHLLKD